MLSKDTAHNFLLIPLQLDALVLPRDHFVAGPMADFSQLPYTDGTLDRNAEFPYLSEACVAPPFQDQALYLQAGVHLHWALPDALTTARQTNQGQQFPLVPNRWIVLRSKNGTIEKQWLVESDYLYPEQNNALGTSISIPYTPDHSKGEVQPYRLLGRTTLLTSNALPAPEAGTQYFQPLTAVGYGEPTFAAFYPNCYSVFGLRDADYTGGSMQNLQYDLVGWYSDASQDFLQIFLQSFTSSYQKQYGTAPDSPTLLSALQDQAKWTFTLGDTQPFPNATLYFSRLTFTVDTAPDLTDQRSDLTIAVGATGTEALSAYLAHTIDESKAGIIEDQLEALYIMAQFEKEQIDIGPAFTEARHARGFTGTNGGSLWTIQPDLSTTSQAQQNQEQVTLPDTMAHQLNTLNTLQQTFDGANQEIADRREQLFADWYKYILSIYRPEDARANYPDIDEIRFTIEQLDRKPLQQQLDATGTLELAFDSTGLLTGAQAPHQASSTLGAQLAKAINDALADITAFNQANAAHNLKTTYLLKQLPSPRYWQPNEPVILAIGPDVEATTRHGQDGRLNEDDLLEGQTLPGSTTVANMCTTRFADLRKLVDGLSKSGENIGIANWTVQPWNPIVLEWEAEVFPLQNQGNLDPSRGKYASDFVTSNMLLNNGELPFTLLEDPLPTDSSPLAVEQIDLSLLDGQGAITRGANLYTGYSVLVPHASELLLDQLTTFLQQNLVPRYYESAHIPADQQSADYFSVHSATLISWYQGSHNPKSQDDVLYTLTQAYALLTASDFHGLSQSLGGFNNALLMRKQTLQLPLVDPLGFDDYQTFTQQISALVQDGNSTSPEPLNDFNPIRNGNMRLQRLRLLDTFGLSRNLDRAAVIATQQMTTDDNPYLINLPLRLSQPARLDFRWLSATYGDQEMNDHPASSPICGWLLPNDLDLSLMIYNNTGTALGQITQQCTWQPAPGAAQAIEPAMIANLALQNLVNELLSRGQTFFNPFFQILNRALEQIEPETFAQHTDLALLMGRPIALVRAALNLELQGLPATHQGWDTLRQEMVYGLQDTNNFTDVLFPLRIGEAQQLNDGVVGFWQETNAQGINGQLFHSAYVADAKNAQITTLTTLTQTLLDKPITLTMLVDPRGTMHATAGVVPVKEITIPPDQFTPAIQAMEISFLTAPLLTNQGQIQLPLPLEAGYNWNWLQKDQSTWSRIRDVPVIAQQSLQTAFANMLWQTLLDPTIAWLTVTLQNTQTASVVASANRASANLGNGFSGVQPIIEKILANQTTITLASFQQQITALLGATLWQDLLSPHTAWLTVTPTDATQAFIVASDSRAAASLPDVFAGLESMIDQIFALNQIQIGPVNLSAMFAQAQELRDGWLLLSSN